MPTYWSEQVIDKGGLLIRLVPSNLFPDGEASQCREVRIASDGHGFYKESHGGVKAYDVTSLWNKRHGDC